MNFILANAASKRVTVDFLPPKGFAIPCLSARVGAGAPSYFSLPCRSINQRGALTRRGIRNLGLVAMAPIHLSRAEHKARLVTKIAKYQGVQDRETVPLEPLQALLTNILTYLQDDEEADEFGDIDDSDLILAESADSVSDSPGIKRKDSSGFWTNLLQRR